MAGGGHGTKAVVAALAANLGIAISKFIGFVITGSASMLAEAIHSVADSGNQGLLLLGGHRARRKADETHPFGYGRERYFWAFIVALVLFSLGGAFAIFEGSRRSGTPTRSSRRAWPSGSCWSRSRSRPSPSAPPSWSRTRCAATPRGGSSSAARRTRSCRSSCWRTWAPRSACSSRWAPSPTSLVTDDPIYDGIGTLLIGLLLTVIAIILAVEMKSLLMGETADPKVQDEIRAGVEQEPEVDRLIHLRTQHIGPDELLIGAKVAFVDGLSVSELAAAVNRVEANVRRAVPEARVMYIEPDVVGTEPAGQPPRPHPRRRPPGQRVTDPGKAAQPPGGAAPSITTSDGAARRRSGPRGLRGRGTPKATRRPAPRRGAPRQALRSRQAEQHRA